jgi:pimeloyl-ACP methyl ester carboxylesterase
MAFARTDDGVQLHYEETGSGTPLVFVHEFAGDHRSWEPQLRHFGRRYRAIAYSARGYPPSDVPASPQAYGQDRATDDILAILDHLGIAKAHICGLSMGAFATLHFGFRYPERAISLCVAGCGSGAEPDTRQRFQADAGVTADELRKKGMSYVAERYAYGPTRVQFAAKDPRGFTEFRHALSQHSALGSANTLLGVQMQRPSLYDLVDQMALLEVPTLIMTGDEDWPCLAPSLLLKKEIPSAALSVIPNCGHTINIEVPDEFNRILREFLAQVDSGCWPKRERLSVAAG